MEGPGGPRRGLLLRYGLCFDVGRDQSRRLSNAGLQEGAPKTLSHLDPLELEVAHDAWNVEVETLTGVADSSTSRAWTSVVPVDFGGIARTTRSRA